MTGAASRCMTKQDTDRYIDPEAFLAAAPHKEGSWWPEWVAWLNARSGEPVAPPAMGAAEAGLCAAWPTRREPTCCRIEQAAGRRHNAASAAPRRYIAPFPRHVRARDML